MGPSYCNNCVVNCYFILQLSFQLYNYTCVQGFIALLPTPTNQSSDVYIPWSGLHEAGVNLTWKTRQVPVI